MELKRLRDDELRLDRHRLLLEAYLPELFRSRSEIRRVSVIEYDQRHRMFWGLGALVAFVISGLVIGPNLTSQHVFYRERLAKTFLNEAEDRAPSSGHRSSRTSRNARAAPIRCLAAPSVPGLPRGARNSWKRR